jgi:ankyrin repeat protein
MPILKMLLEAKADVNSSNGWAIQAAAEAGHIDIIEELIKHDANINAAKIKEGVSESTALQAATEAGNLELVQLLLKHKADPNLGYGYYSCPLIAAVCIAEEEITKLLLTAGAHTNVLGGPGNSTPLIYAAESLPSKWLNMLLDAGADINQEDTAGDTALIIAALNGNLDRVRTLLERGANVLHVNGDGKNALQTGASSNNDECVELLIDHVSKIMSAMNKSIGSGNIQLSELVTNSTANIMNCESTEPKEGLENTKSTAEEDDREEEEDDDKEEEEEVPASPSLPQPVPQSTDEKSTY